MADFNLTNVESLSFQKTFNFLGDIFTYTSTDSYTIQSRVYGPRTGDIEYSIDPVWNLLESTSQKNQVAYYGFILDGVNLGSGRITSFNWEQGADLVEKKFTMSFEVPSSGNLFNLTGISYQDIDKSIFSGNFKYVNDFQENISLSLNSSKIQEISQNVSFGIDYPLSEVDKLALKNKIFSGFAQYRIPNLGLRTYYLDIISGNINSGYISYFNESSDLLNGRFSFDRKSYYDDSSQKASWSYVHSLQLNGNDITVSENGSIKSIYFSGLSSYRNLSGARMRWGEIRTGIYERVSGTFNAISGFSGIYTSGDTCSLVATPIDKRFQEDPFAGTIDYSYSYSNNLSFTVSGYIFSNSRSSSVDQDGYYTITENGEYKGIAYDNDERFENALEGYTLNNSLILPRVSGTFLMAKELNKFLCPPTGNFRLSNESTTYREFDGVVSYSNNYSNNPSYYSTNPNFIKYVNVISNKKPVHLHNKFLIPRSDEVIQSAKQSTEGTYTNNIKIIGRKGVSIDTYLTESYSKVIRPTGTGILDNFLRSMSYSLNPFLNEFEATFDYYYTQYKEPDDILI